MRDTTKAIERIRIEICKLWEAIADINKHQSQVEPHAEPKPLLADARVGDLCKTDLDEWIQIDDASEPPSPILYHFDRQFKGNIIHTEPLADEGSAEWAWQMLKLGKPVTNKRVFIAGGYIKDTNSDKYQFVQMWGYSGWKIYEKPEPEPAKEQFEVGDWVLVEGGKQGKIDHFCSDDLFQDNSNAFVLHDYMGRWYGYYKVSSIISILQPSEVKVSITLEGTVEQVFRGGNVFMLRYGDGLYDYAVIDFAHLTEPDRNLVKSLLDEMEEEK